jgi:MATE family multidrug resistance protein
LQAFSLTESRSLIILASPIAATSLLNIGMAITDVMMMGRLGPGAVAAGAIISDLYSIVFYLCAGILAAVSPEISQAIGARRSHAVRAATQQGFWMAAVLAALAFPIIWNAPQLLHFIGIEATIVAQSTGYAKMMALATIPMFGIAIWRNVYTALSLPRAIMVSTIVALPANAALNYVFMFGALGIPAMGVTGAGVASALIAFGIFLALSLYAHINERFRAHHFMIRFAKPNRSGLAELARVGIPIGFSSFGEVGLFLISTLLAGLFGVEALAAHAITLRMAGVVYAWPSGLSQAATVRVAYAVGSRDPRGIKRAAWTALMIGGASGIALCFALIASRNVLPGVFLPASSAPAIANLAITDLAALLLALLSVVCLAQGIGTVGMGALRGLKDTRLPMMSSLFGFWFVGMATILLLSFFANWDVTGIWTGIAAGAVTTALLIVLRMVMRLHRGVASAPSSFLSLRADRIFGFQQGELPQQGT